MGAITGTGRRVRIDVEKAFRLRDAVSTFKPSDYTDYPSGKECTIEKVQGFISQTGLHKRDGDKLKERVAQKNLQVPPPGDKAIQNVGILSAVDKFFNWLNALLGDKE